MYRYSRVNEDYIYVGYTFSGVTLFDRKGNSWKKFLDGESVSCVMEDHEGGIWITTISSGVFYTESLDFDVIDFGNSVYVSSIGAGKEEDPVYFSLNIGDTYEYSDGALSLSIKNAARFRGPTFYQYYEPVGLLTYLNSVRLKNIVVGGSNFSLRGGYIRKLSDEVDRDPVLIGNSGVYVCYKNKYVHYGIKGRLEDACGWKGKLFVAKGDGVYMYDTLTKKTEQLDNELVKYSIKDIDLFRSNSLLIATQGGGLVFVNNDKIWNIGVEDGLSSDLVMEVYVENDSTLWTCTNKGVDRIKLRSTGDYSIRSLGVEDGLIGSDAVDIRVVRGTVWVATRSGLCSFPSLELMEREQREQDYFLRILETKVNDVTTTSLIDLPYWKNRVEINFEAISYRQRDGLTYRYKLVGVENKWTYTKDLKVVYQSLPPGEYYFYIQAGVKDQWSAKIIKFPIVVLPPFLYNFLV